MNDNYLLMKYIKLMLIQMFIRSRYLYYQNL